jgi:hypothetical protein
MSLKRCVLLTLCVALASCAEHPKPEIASVQVRGALSGARQKIESFYNVNPDCTTGGYPTLKVAKAALHGHVEIEQGTAFAEYPKDNIRASCNGRNVPATVVYYTSEPAYVGSDSVAFERIGVSGGYGYHEYTINVR